MMILFVSFLHRFCPHESCYYTIFQGWLFIGKSRVFAALCLLLLSDHSRTLAGDMGCFHPDDLVGN
ncbi:hypothetical protein CDL12_06627 [Handroanthus impetiginosus]|uniref:Uncharacterized protein n=1 Tax=Handroanthus impetiginosus TaxID=429701 RepID=A0A2G9HT55_9LAMI|nr:hypothetical protein CDL12_06627 [Handroanthus impetiginosus]